MRLTFAAAGFLTLLLGTAALGHQQRLSTAALRVEGARVQARLRLSASDAAGLVPLDRDGNGRVAATEVAAAREDLVHTFLGGLRLRSSGAACAAPARGDASLEEGDGLVLTGEFDCPGEVRLLEVRVGFLALLPPGHTHLAEVEFVGDPQIFQRVVQQDAETFTVERRDAPTRASLRLLRLGVEHIFAGYDHVAFLLGLLLLGGSLATLVKVVTSFTVAHSISLALATFGLLTPPARVVEPLIAASIVFVAVENLWALRAAMPEETARALRRRWRLTFAFGLVHGFGFADALRELHLPRTALALSLVTFNLGVEAGQVCIVALALPILTWLRKRRGFIPSGQGTASAAIGALGVFWLVQRLLG